jgi:hypothetical protein
MFILSGYFFRDYAVRKRWESLAWGLGFLLYSSNFIYLTIYLFSELTSSYYLIGYTTVWMLLIAVVFGMTLLYYGASLIIFSPGSFFREKILVLIIPIYLILVYYFIKTSLFLLEEVPFLERPILATPVFFAIATLFYNVFRKRDLDNHARRASLIMSLAWYLIAISSGLMALIIHFDILGTFFLIVQNFQSITWIFAVYSIVFRKTFVLIQEREQQNKSQILICPRCKNRIQKDWTVCPYCKARLR